jgi:peptidoglycan hydrolase-like protein with peptidoglycan-binding domain
VRRRKCIYVLGAFSLVILSSIFNDGIASEAAGNAPRIEASITLRWVLGGSSSAPGRAQDILIVRNNKSVTAQINMELQPGDTIATGDDGAVLTIKSGDGVAVVLVRANTQTDILSFSEVRAVVGRLFAKVRGLLGKDAFRVKTKYGTAAAEGTMFDVAVDDNSAVIGAFEGIVRIEPNRVNSEPLFLQPAEAAILTSNEPPRQITMPFERTVEIIKWVQSAEQAIQEMENTNEGTSIGQFIPTFDELSKDAIARRGRVREAQAHLKALGYAVGRTDGVIDAMTQEAVRQFKRDKGLPGGPVIDEVLLEALRQASREREQEQEVVNPSPSPERTLGLGLPDPLGGKTYPKGILTVEQLKYCLQLDHVIVTEKPQADKAVADLETAQKEIERFRSSVESQRTQVDRRDKASVERFNELVRKQRKMVEDFNNNILPKGNAQLESFNRKVNEINAYCVGNQYYLTDMEIARKGLEAEGHHGAAQRARVREAQVMLEQLGYSPGPVDGVETAQTLEAIRRFKQEAHLPGGPIIDDALLEILKARLMGDRRPSTTSRQPPPGIEPPPRIEREH